MKSQPIQPPGLVGGLTDAIRFLDALGNSSDPDVMLGKVTPKDCFLISGGRNFYLPLHNNRVIGGMTLRARGAGENYEIQTLWIPETMAIIRKQLDRLEQRIPEGFRFTDPTDFPNELGEGYQ